MPARSGATASRAESNTANLRNQSEPSLDARRWYIRGRVQGVGYRNFAQHSAQSLGLTGYARNLDDGRVEVYAAGPAAQLAELAVLLYRGPRWADVRGVEEQEAAVEVSTSFRIG